MRQVSRATAGLAVIAGVLVALPAPAWAHTELLGTSPAGAEMVTSLVEEVTLTFSGPVRAEGSSVVVTDSGGQSQSTGVLSVLDFVVHQPVLPLGSGPYRVTWTVVASDGHPLTGEFQFQVNLPPELQPTPSATPAPSPAATDPSAAATDAASAATAGSSPLGWLVAAAVLGAAVVVALVLHRRRRAGPTG